MIQLAEKTASPELEDVKGLSTARVAEILKVVERSEMKVVFFGRTSNGKSTVINALIKSKVLPSGPASTTTTVCYIRGQSTAIEGGFVEYDGSNERIPVEVCLQVSMYVYQAHLYIYHIAGNISAGKMFCESIKTCSDGNCHGNIIVYCFCS